MANDLTHDPLILDTAAVISATLTFKIRKVVLTGNTASATAQIKNGSSQVIGDLQCTAGAVDELNFPNGYVVKGFELAAIAGAGAKLEVYCG